MYGTDRDRGLGTSAVGPAFPISAAVWFGVITGFLEVGVPVEARNLISSVRGRKRAGRLRRALEARIRHERTRLTRRVRQ